MNENELNNLSGKIINAAIEVHKHLGPGLLEGVYETCLAKEFDSMQLNYQRQLELPIWYKGESLDSNLRLDFLVADQIVVELKSIESLLPKHDAQLLTYLKLADKKLGLLINFNVSVLKNGIRRKVNGTL